MGVAVGLAALSRSELILLSVLVIVPLVLLVRTVPLGRRVGWIAAAAATCVGVVGPWVVFNLTRFDHPVYLSAGYEITLSTATCDLTWYGEFTGYWNIQCPIGVLQRHGVDSRGADQSELAKLFRQDSIDYIRSHEKRLPYVLLARWGRITGLYKPLQQVNLDHFPEGRNIWVARSALAGWYIVAPLAIGGAFVLRKRRIPVFPLLAPPAIVLVAVHDHVRDRRATERPRRARSACSPRSASTRSCGCTSACATTPRTLRRSTNESASSSTPDALAARAPCDREEDQRRGVDRLGDRELVRGDRRRFGSLAVEERIGDPPRECVEPHEPRARQLVAQPPRIELEEAARELAATLEVGLHRGVAVEAEHGDVLEVAARASGAGRRARRGTRGTGSRSRRARSA